MAEVTGKDESPAQRSQVELPLGEAMTIAECYGIASARRVQVVVIAGAVKSGKTTLIASLFHSFQRGPLCDYPFAGSQTLIGFDQRCHDARTVSNRSRQAMERTKRREERALLHLQVRPQADMSRSIDLLLTDLSGEDFEDAKNSLDECRSVPLIKRADHFVLLVDGERLSNNDTRQGAKNEAQMLLRCCLEAGQLGSRSLVDVLISKWDILSTSQAADSAIAFSNAMQQSITNQFASRLGRLRFHNIAVRPDTSEFELGHGLDQVFPCWLEETPDNVLARIPFIPNVNAHCEFDQFLRRSTRSYVSTE